MAKVDLHMHSSYSDDGDYSPEELVSLASKAGLKAIAVTDHNSTRGVDEAVEAGKALGIEVVPAVELDCLFNDLVFHVLGYYIDYKYEKYFQVEKEVLEQNIAASRRRVELVNRIGIEVEYEEVLALSKDGAIQGELIAEAVLNKPESRENPLLRPYLPGGSRSDNPYVNFYWDFCAQGKPAYVHIEYMSLQEAISLIAETGGIPVLAHPGNSLKGRMELLEDIVNLGIQGIEAYSSYHTPEQNSFFARKAEEYRLLITGGSDFHGKTKPSVFMGRFGLEGDGMDILKSLKKQKQIG
ncbi:MAG: PHP domain-containing protein [Clostridiales bacterium]|jgi:predicted metal-dependent phosphoesterase TrpH|nr:PHP domain-containing protein [Clostridiales bacterium]